jgi:hypothetical protein
MWGALACSSTPGVSSDAGAPDTKPSSGPYLTSLVVSAASPSAPALVLVPPFASDVSDYYVVCGAESNEVTVAMEASPGASSSLIQPTTSPSKAKQTVSLTVKTDQAIVATATAGMMSREYWVRCLSPDFPGMMMVKHPEAGTPPPGYYLLGIAGAPGYALVLDGNGVPVWYWYGAGAFADIDHLSPEAVTFFIQNDAPAVVHQLSPLKTYTVGPTGVTYFDPHELQRLPSGNYYALSNPVEKADLTGLPITLPDGGAPGPDTNMAVCDIIEFEGTQPTGNVVWTWVGDKHLDPVKDSVYPDMVDFSSTGVVAVDPYHCNSIDIDPANGNLLVSSRNMDSIFYIERSTGKILWKMGGSTFTKEGAPYVPIDDPFYGQHDARLLPGWSTCGGGRGQVSVFDDHTFVSGPARGIVIDIVVGADGGSDCDTGGGGIPGATVSWQYAGAGASADRGSFRILADGSRVIGWGTPAAPPIAFTEVDEQENDLLDFYFAGADVSYRAIKVPLSAFDLSVLRNTAGGHDGDASAP